MLDQRIRDFLGQTMSESGKSCLKSLEYQEASRKGNESYKVLEANLTKGQIELVDEYLENIGEIWGISNWHDCSAIFRLGVNLGIFLAGGTC